MLQSKWITNLFMQEASSAFKLAKLSLVCISFLFCCAPAATVPMQPSQELALQKINFDITEINEAGLIGPPDGKVLVAYLFNIPLDSAKRREVTEIDSSVHFFSRPPENYYQCIGEGATPQVLLKLASLPYIKKINRFYGE